MASAQESPPWALRDGDVRLDAAGLTEYVVGRTLTFYDNGRSKFGDVDAYSYTYERGGTAFGRYDMREDGIICIAFRNGFGRCDMYVLNDGRLAVLTEEGERFPVRD